jgi:hypothetical protein
VDVSNPFAARPERLLNLVRQVNDEFAAEGRPLPLPPDPDDAELDREFWDRVALRLTAEERQWLRF